MGCSFAFLTTVAFMSHQLSRDDFHHYAEQMTTPESPALTALNRETHLKVELPIMLSGHLQGAFLTMISQMIRPKNILEIGTYTGYSAICLAQGLAEGGRLHTMDINEELRDMNDRYWQEAGVADCIVAYTGKAADIIPKLDVAFDLVFIDADKQGYAHYFDLVVGKMPVGGFLLADNVFYDGEVMLPQTQQSKNAKAIHAFNEKIKADPRVSQVMVPLRDGITLIRKERN